MNATTITATAVATLPALPGQRGTDAVTAFIRSGLVREATPTRGDVIAYAGEWATVLHVTDGTAYLHTYPGCADTAYVRGLAYVRTDVTVDPTDPTLNTPLPLPA